MPGAGWRACRACRASGGRAPGGRSVGVEPAGSPEHHGVPGPDGHAVYRQGSRRFDHAGRVVVAAGAGTGDQDDQVGVGGGLDQGRGDPSEGRPPRSRSPGPRSRPPALGRPASASWCPGSRPALGSVPMGRISSPVGMITTLGGRLTINSTAPAAAAAATSTGRSRWPSGNRSSLALMSSPIERTCW